MALPVIIAAHDDADVLERVEGQLAERYSRHYRIEVVRNPAEAAQLLAQLAGEDADVALVLAGPVALEVGDGELFDQCRGLHPQAKRALLVSPNVWTDPPKAATIRRAMGLGRIDHFILEPGPPPDEVFHEGISSFLLEWARERRLVPHTVHIVGKEWAGRALRAAGGLRELRRPAQVLPGRLRAGTRAPREGGPGRPAPAHGVAGRARAQRPVERRDRDRGGCAGRRGGADVRPRWWSGPGRRGCPRRSTAPRRA